MSNGIFVSSFKEEAYRISKKLNYTKAIIMHPSTQPTYIDSSYEEKILYINTSYVPKIISKDNRSESLNLSFEEIEAAKKVIMRYHNLFKKSELRNLDETIMLLFRYCVEKLFEYNIDLALFPMIPHQNLEYIFYLAAKNLRIKIFFNLEFPLLSNLCSIIGISDEFNSYGTIFQKFYDDSVNQINLEVKDILRPYIAAYTLGDYGETKQLVYNENPRKLTRRNYKRFFIDLKNKFLASKTEVFLKRALTIAFSPLFKISNLIREKHFLNYVDRLSEKFLDEESLYLYFPLHYQPEASTIPAGQGFVDQFELVESISKDLPKNYRLFIKEHPAYWNKPLTPIMESRSYKDYKRLRQLSNVVLVSRQINTYTLLKNSFCAVTITGTIALEALANGKYCLNFGLSPHRQLINSINIKSSKDTVKAISFIEENKFNEVYEFNRFLNSLGNIIYSEAPGYQEKIIQFKVDSIKKYIETT
jgi:hypothetical protein